jgi:prepilin-type N-terminal cleavage/methylation domain-containing protein
MKQGEHIPMTAVRSSKGFTLVEVMIATVILGLSLMALVPLLSTAASIDRENYLNVKARALAAQQLDTLMGIDSLSSGCPSVATNTVIKPCNSDTKYPTAATPIVDEASNAKIYVNFAWNWTSAGSNLANIVVDTEYTYKGQTKRFVLTSQKVTQ